MPGGPFLDRSLGLPFPGVGPPGAGRELEPGVRPGDHWPRRLDGGHDLRRPPPLQAEISWPPGCRDNPLRPGGLWTLERHGRFRHRINPRHRGWHPGGPPWALRPEGVAGATRRPRGGGFAGSLLYNHLLHPVRRAPQTCRGHLPGMWGRRLVGCRRRRRQQSQHWVFGCLRMSGARNQRFAGETLSHNPFLVHPRYEWRAES